MKRKSLSRIFAVFMALSMMCLCSLVVTAVGDIGNVQVKVADFAEGVELGLYRVGVYSEGKYVLDEDYADCDVDLSDLSEASVTKEIAEVLEVKAQSVGGATVVPINSEGVAEFTGLSTDDVLYLICQMNGDNIVDISPMLTVLPYYTEEGEEKTDVIIDAKFSDKRSEEVFGAIILNKENRKGERLSGAEFRLEQRAYFVTDEEVEKYEGSVIKDDDGDAYIWEVVAEKLVSNEHGQIVVKNLPLNYYRFIETKAPDGYSLDSTPHEVFVENEGTVRVEGDFYVPDVGDPQVLLVLNDPKDDSNPSPPPASSTPESKPSTPSINPPQPSNPVITGEDGAKFIMVSMVVTVSLAAVIMALVAGKKRRNQ